MLLAVELPLGKIFLFTKVKQFQQWARQATCITRHTSRNSRRGERVIMFIPLPFFWNSSRISLPHRLDDTAVNSDSFAAEITNRLKETELISFSGSPSKLSGFMNLSTCYLLPWTY